MSFFKESASRRREARQAARRATADLDSRRVANHSWSPASASFVQRSAIPQRAASSPASDSPERIICVDRAPLILQGSARAAIGGKTPSLVSGTPKRAEGSQTT